ncbi:TPA: hypothetical protein TXJ06_001312 [Streptococcus suis]|nr:hypothetical protein [Streptococcus suis]
MKKNTRKALISTLIFIPLFVLFQLWGNSGVDILHTISQVKFWLQLLITGAIYFLGLAYLPPIFRRK